MRVRATSVGYYDHALRSPGNKRGFDVFEIKSEEEFSWEWMEPIGWTPKKPKPDGVFNSDGTKNTPTEMIDKKIEKSLSDEAAKVAVAPAPAAPAAPAAAAPAEAPAAAQELI